MRNKLSRRCACLLLPVLLLSKCEASAYATPILENHPNGCHHPSVKLSYHYSVFSDTLVTRTKVLSNRVVGEFRGNSSRIFTVIQYSEA